MRLGNLPHTLLREVCESLATERDVMEQFFKAFRWSQSDQVRQRWGIFGILKKHSATPVQLLRNVCASLLDDDDIAVKLLDGALLSYKPLPSLHLVRPLGEIRDIRNERIQRKPVTYIQRGAILIMYSGLSPGIIELQSFFTDLDPTSEVTILDLNSHDVDITYLRTLHSWQQNQGQ